MFFFGRSQSTLLNRSSLMLWPMQNPSIHNWFCALLVTDYDKRNAPKRHDKSPPAGTVGLIAVANIWTASSAPDAVTPDS
jgi:hypothetical protein